MVGRWTAAEVARITGGTLEGEGGVRVGAVTTDSRVARTGDVFFALDGASFRGEDFVPGAFGSGCSVVVVRSGWSGALPRGSAVIRHAEPLDALSMLAASVRDAWDCPVIGITGSVGKTSVKEMTALVLSGVGRVERSPGNFNTVEGLSRTLLEIEGTPDAVVLELAASRPGEIARLAGIARPTAAALTNVAPAHLDGFGSVEGVLGEKLALFAAVPAEGICVVDGDDLHLAEAASRASRHVVRVGFDLGNDFRAKNLIPVGTAGTRFRVSGGHEGSLMVPGPHQVRNALFALALGEAHGVPISRGLEALATFEGVPGRLSVREVGGALLVDDSYNSNPRSAVAALDWFAGLETVGRKAVVLGDMLELGGESASLHAELMEHLKSTGPDFAILVGDALHAAHAEGGKSTRPEILAASDADSAARTLGEWVGPGDAVLVKGSRGMGLEIVVDELISRRCGEDHAV
ncbi:MAG: UDP-N-acetylmuramoylalanyl-D-glutamate--2,6-diaminopimelate ligase [Gemmatimonadetes bacterium]|nr:UDP-N-acetylmuramoylalanyl-D-glutamate--2,6-diaminopimelate ligase [Gemmatimonadota bacterium]